MFFPWNQNWQCMPNFDYLPFSECIENSQIGQYFFEICGLYYPWPHGLPSNRLKANSFPFDGFYPLAYAMHEMFFIQQFLGANAGLFSIDEISCEMSSNKSSLFYRSSTPLESRRIVNLCQQNCVF
jgi:hypothetical protein